MDRKRRTRWSGVRGRVNGTAFRAAAGVILLVAALLGMTRFVAPGSVVPATVVLLDASDSVLRPRPAWSKAARATLRAAAQAAQARGAPIEVVSYGRGSATLFELGDARDLLAELSNGNAGLLAGRRADLDPRSSDLMAALESLEAKGRFDRDEIDAVPQVDRLLWLSDGRVDRPERMRAKFELLASIGVQVELLDPGPELRGDLALARLRVPERIAPDAAIPLAAALELQGPLPEQAWIEVRVGSGSGWESGDELLRVELTDLEPGAREVRWELPALRELGATASTAGLEFEVRVASPRGSDAFPENDARRFRILPAGSLEVLVVAQSAAAAKQVAGDLGLDRDPGFVLRSAGREQFAAELGRAAVLVLAGLAPADLEPPVVEGFLRSGGGVLWFGGASQLVPRDGAGVLPLLPFVAEPIDREPRHVRLLMDRSGSMEGEPFEAVREAAFQLARAMASGDRLTLQFFTDALLTEIPLLSEGDVGGDAERSARVRELVALPRASGATALLYSLEQLAARRAKAPAPGTHELVLLLTDGREESDPVRVSERAKALADSLARSSTELCAIAIGDRAEIAYLTQLAGPRGEVLLAPDAADLERLVEERSLADRFFSASGLAIALPGPFDLGFSSSWSAPGRAVHGRVREGAQLLLESGMGEPLAAAWRVGAGLCVALASQPSEDFGAGWYGRGDLFGPLLRGLETRERQLGPKAQGGWGATGAGLRVSGLEVEGPPKRSARFLGTRELSLELGPDPAAQQPGEFIALGPAEALEALAMGEAGPSGLLVLEDRGQVLRLPLELPPLPEHRPLASGLKLEPPRAVRLPAAVRGAHPSHRPLLVLGLLVGLAGLLLGAGSSRPRR